MKKNMLDILKLKRTRVLLGMVALSTVVSFSGCGKKDENKSFSDVVNEVKGKTCFDEYAETKDPDLITDADNLIEYINLSEILNNLLKDEIKDTKLQIGNEELLSPADVTNLMYDYEADSSNEEITTKILVQNALINDYILNNGYSIAANLEIAVLKASWADSFGFCDDSEISLPIMEQIIIPGREVGPGGVPEKDPNLDKTITIGKNKYKIGDYHYITEEIYTLQENNSEASLGKGYEYNDDRNDMIMNAIETSKDILIDGTKPLIKAYKK